MEHERSLIEDITRLRTEALKLQGEDTISQKCSWIKIFSLK